MDDKFVTYFNIIASNVHETAKEKGWWDKEGNGAEFIALCHSELSEALEAMRNGCLADKDCPEFSNLEIELSDVIIRIMDYSYRNRLRISEALIAKKEFNKTRSKMHGGKKF